MKRRGVGLFLPFKSRYRKVYIFSPTTEFMPEDKRPSRDLVGKQIVTKEGKSLGEVQDVTFEVRTGELVNVLVKNPTKHSLQLGMEKTEHGFSIPYNSILAVGDFVVVAEEDLL